MAENRIEPWPGYADQEPDQRIVTFEHKAYDARRRSDLLYALSICAAVAAYEELERGGAGDETGVERAAKALGGEINDFADEHLGDAGGWTPK
jgi:hypothetical protein